MLSVKQGGIKYHFLSLWYDSTWDLTQVSRTIGEHSNRLANVQFSISTQFDCQKHFYFKLFKQLYVKTQLSVNTVVMSKNSSISNNSVKHEQAV